MFGFWVVFEQWRWTVRIGLQGLLNCKLFWACSWMHCWYSQVTEPLLRSAQGSAPQQRDYFRTLALLWNMEPLRELLEAQSQEAACQRMVRETGQRCFLGCGRYTKAVDWVIAGCWDSFVEWGYNSVCIGSCRNGSFQIGCMRWSGSECTQ